MEENLMEKFQEKLKELLVIAKKKKNVLEYSEITDLFSDMNLTAEQMDSILEYLEKNNIDTLRTTDDDEEPDPEEAVLDEEDIDVEKIDLSVPVYISIDKDVLDESISETNWSQGHMKLGTLEHMLGIIIRNQKVLGIDICGECDTNMPLPEYMEDEEKNGELNKELYNFLLKRLKKYSL